MNCEQSHHYLNPLVDNELPIETTAKVMCHFESCLECQSDWTALLRVNDAVKEVISRIEVPDGLSDRIRTKVDSAKLRNLQSKPGRGSFKVLGMVAAVAIVAFALHSISSKGGNKENLVASDFVHAYQASANVDASGASQNEQVQQKRAMLANLSGWTLVKSEHCKLDNIPAVRLCYMNEQKQKLSCYQLKHGLFDATGLKKHSMNGRVFCCGQLDHVSIVYCPNEKGDNILVSSLSERELMSIAMRS